MRRTFLKTSLAVAGALALSLPSASLLAQTKTIKISH